MTTQQFLTSAWTWNIATFVASGATLVAYLWLFGINRRILYLLAALGLFLLTLSSPLNALATGYLFSAHMLQHILLLLIVPALVLMSLPRCVTLGPRSWIIGNPLVGWMAGEVGGDAPAPEIPDHAGGEIVFAGRDRRCLEVGDRAEQGRARRWRQPRIAEAQEQREREARPHGVASDDNL